MAGAGGGVEGTNGGGAKVGGATPPANAAARGGAARVDRGGGLLLGPQLIDQGRQERPLRLLGLAAACQPLRNLQKHLGGAMIGGDFRNHLPVIGGPARKLRRRTATTEWAGSS